MQVGKSRVLALFAVLSIAASACGTSTTTPNAATGNTGTPPTAAPTPAPTQASADVYPRAETLYTTGKQWGAPSTWNPVDPNAAMGVVGLQYETLFLYDPLKDVYTPWLATADSAWDATKTTYTIKLRSGVKWSDGSAFTADDVAFTLLLAKNPVAGSTLWNYVTDATATDASTVVVKFNGPAYQEWAQWLYNTPIVPKAVFESKNNADLFKFTNENGVGTGPYLYKTHSDTTMVWVKNDNWWGKSASPAMDVKPKYIVDIVNGANNVALGQLLQGGIDLSNNFLPGVASLVAGGYGVTTYFPGVPYMLAGNTAVLVPNTAKKPLDDPAFRKALATAINTDDIVQKVYGNIVTKADPTGLLPFFSKYVDTAQRDAMGFSFSTAKAKSMLAAAGYKVGSDGMVTNKDGSALKLNLEVPDGWSDWMAAENSIAASAKLAGINIVPAHPDYNTVVADRNRTDATTAPKFDLIINNDVQVGNTPWTWYDYVFRQPLPFGAAENRNYEGYSNADAWKLTQQLDKTPVDDLTSMKSIAKQLQAIQLKDMPVIPLWYNGIWSQVNNSVWTNFPTSTGNQVLPATWNGYWQMGAVLMLTQHKAVPPAK
jgi:peptide/nickel transport system substrate-binding protein